MVDAILAYDCAANPNRKPKAKSLAFWQCLQNVSACSDVVKCVMPDQVAECSVGGFIGCTQAAADPDTRLDCITSTVTDAGGAPAPAENCVMRGQTCASNDPDASNNGALCTGPLGLACNTTAPGCLDGGLVLCDDAGIDHGADCRNVGGGSCSVSGASPACEPEGTTTCIGTNDITCTPGNVQAQGCVTGTAEMVDCTAISGSGTCVPIEGGAPGTLPSDACYIDGGCLGDTCSGSSLDVCIRGRSITVDCVGLGLGSCNPVTTEEGIVASCTPP